jgi:hypothetical protein
MNPHLLADASTPFDSLFGLGVFGVIAGLILGGLYLLCPIIVMIQLSRQNNKQGQIIEELKTQNNLSRQLLRAYGHDPEA